MVPVTASQIRSLSSVTCPRMERSCLHEFNQCDPAFDATPCEGRHWLAIDCFQRFGPMSGLDGAEVIVQITAVLYKIFSGNSAKQALVRGEVLSGKTVYC